MGEVPPTGLPRWPLEAEQTDLLDAADDVAHVMDRALETAVPLAAAPDGGDAALIGSFHAVRALRCLRTVVTVCRSGYAVEAAPIVRSMLEDAVSLRFLSLRPRSRVAKWLSFDEQRSLEYWRLSERLGLGLEKSEHIRRIEEGPRTTGSPVWWSNKTPSAMARELRDADPDLSQTFKALYPWLSDVAHANIKTTSSYYFAEADGEPVLRIGPSDHLLHLMTDLAVALSLRTCTIARDLGADIDLGAVVERVAAYDAASAEAD
jgi:hypothetical protein